MKTNYLLLALITLTAVLGFYMMGNPEQADRLTQVSRDVAFKGEARELALMAVALGIGGFIAYLTITRR